MKRLVTIDDITDVLHKFKQRGFSFILSKLNIIGIIRTEKTFNQLNYKSADWWIIPKVKERWNILISGNKNTDYKDYLINNYLQNKKNLKLISLGSGSSHHEIELAKHSNFDEIICIDIAENRILEAKSKANKLMLKNIKFVCADFNNYNIPKEYFDIVFFHASLHHFDNIDNCVANTIKKSLKPGGLLVINEYVGATRLQFSKQQIIKINEALNIIPKEYRTRYKSNLLKKKFHGPGIIRMILADPSECVDSVSILPAIHSNFHTIIEKPYGGNILMNVLKDISHHFINLDSDNNQILEKLFSLEDEYLKNNPSDFIFGIYQKISPIKN
ncbi:class I SAM-dependent methyltransferase [Formosa sediminum]|uniref:Class I SAM-dependent methyltransferase n=1 Tax=Formosa sediminum TaxID=2594004 RepID=A0A516GLW0_9FLAO|nr:class I SAM-dependent methyltransferase [Formosa sediminum]QDO92507.1 class I SAM-dependent methyltransferase [Formosa sediminum]